jgi:Uncharacterized protein containing a TIR (Toll-Interleukin 1-resistance) domain
MPNTSPDFDLALSFAGEDRTYVEMVARFLNAHGVSFFYDDYQSTDLWGKDLYSHLTSVYSKARRHVVMFISQHYANKVWTSHERRAAQSRALREKGEYILPVRFDDTEIEGLLPTVGYVDARRLSPEMLASKILEKLGRPIILAKANTLPAPNNPAFTGDARFKFRSHDGRFEIGTGDLSFETRWTSAGSSSIHCYNDAPSVRGIALVPLGWRIEDIHDVSALDFTSRVRTPSIGQFVALQNVKGFYALLHIEGIHTTAHGGDDDELRFRYWIQPDGSSDFSTCS